MSYPFILWTMQRTGGTALAELLMTISEWQAAEHEPFNRDRQFGAVTAAFAMNRDEDQLEKDLAAIFAQGYLIKHTYELRNKALNAAVLHAAVKAGYRHLLLVRRDEFSRLVSKFVAEANGTWFKGYAGRVYEKIRTGERSLGPIPIEKIVAAYQHCREMTDEIRSSLQAVAPDFHEVDYEDLYTGEESARRARLDELFRFLDFPPARIEAERASIEEKVLGEGMDTRSIMPFLPNLNEVVEALQAAGCEPPSAFFDGIEKTLPEEEAAAAPAHSADEPRLANAGWGFKLVGEFQRLAAKYGLAPPFLEIGSRLIGPAIVSGDYFFGKELHGIGFDKSQVSSPITVYNGNIINVLGKFKDGYFSTIFSNAALEHDSEFWRTLNELKRLLPPGGTLAVAVPGFREMKKESGIKVIGTTGHHMRQATPTFRIHGPSDYWRFSPRALREVILSGFEVKELKPVGSLNWMIGIGVKTGS